jgi:hypothetical protein
MTMRPVSRVSVRPMCFQDLPPSVDLYTPSPQPSERSELRSPVPTHTTSLFEGATATSPMDANDSSSNTGCHVVPALVVFHTPPDA